MLGLQEKSYRCLKDKEDRPNHFLDQRTRSLGPSPRREENGGHPKARTIREASIRRRNKANIALRLFAGRYKDLERD